MQSTSTVDNTMAHTAYIVDCVRTPGGRRNGTLRDWHPADLGAVVVNSIIDRNQIDGSVIDDVIFGCVSQVGAQVANVARNIVLSSKLPESVPGTSVDRQCGSSQQALHFAAQAVMSGTMDVVVAGGRFNFCKSRQIRVHVHIAKCSQKFVFVIASFYPFKFILNNIIIYFGLIQYDDGRC